MNDSRTSMKINLWQVYWNRHGTLYKKCIGILKCDLMSNGLYNENPDIFSVVWKCSKKLNKVPLKLMRWFYWTQKIFINLFLPLDLGSAVVVLLKRHLSLTKASVTHRWLALCYDNIQIVEV